MFEVQVGTFNFTVLIDLQDSQNEEDVTMDEEDLNRMMEEGEEAVIQVKIEDDSMSVSSMPDLEAQIRLVYFQVSHKIRVNQCTKEKSSGCQESWLDLKAELPFACPTLWLPCWVGKRICQVAVVGLRSPWRLGECVHWSNAPTTNK